MKITFKLMTAPLLAASLLLGGTSAFGAGIDQAVVGGDGQRLAQVSTVAGKGDLGESNGKASDATFRAPWSLLALDDGSVLVADARSHLLRKLSGADVSAFAGITIEKDAYNYPIGGFMDGKAASAVFQEPKGLGADAAGNVYVADSKNHAIRKIDKSGSVTTLAGSGVIGSKDGKGKDASFQLPQDVAVTADGTVYVADSLNHAIRRIAPDGTVTTLNALSTRAVEVVKGQVVPAGDFADGALQTAKFNEPTGIALDAKGNLYVSDSGNQLIRYIDLSAGTVTTVAGDPSVKLGKTELYVAGDFADGDAAQAKFNFPKGLTVTSDGGVLIADSLNHSIRYLKDGTVVTVAGEKDQYEGNADGTERNARLQHPADVAVLPDGSLLVADAYNNRIRQITFYELPAGMTADGTIKVVYGNRPIDFDALPELSNGRTMVPVRVIAEALGFEVTFDENAQTGERQVNLGKAGTTVGLTIGKAEVRKTVQAAPESTKSIDVAPYIKDDRTYVPVRFFAEELGLDVQWDNATSTVILRDKLTR
ncbi:stalk domain-containing protein [Paenibacillus flagellatus]|uniref:Copper amine oxidase n=1 Tax=Paenibacillus flagellatus TaxID=2211139 RepID=A0A2V5KAJ1_9BACL|nr:stalk domain-containing protein [Paenibacillus flagellatus]PYI56468.1 copper amine oxidase [Paenibacillus flagellatus]